MLAAKRSAGVTQEMNLRNPLCEGDEAISEGVPPGFEIQGRCHQKSKTEISVAPPKLIFKKKCIDDFAIFLLTSFLDNNQQ